MSMDETTVRKALRGYIARDLMRDPDYPLTDDEGIITGGLIDSFALAELAVYIERQFGVHIPDPELTVARMDTLDQIVARVLRDG
jgi:acyl carrier protein